MFEKLTTLNNTGVELLQRSAFKQAAQHFHHALREARSSLAEQSSVMSGAPPSCPLDDEDETLCGPPLSKNIASLSHPSSINVRNEQECVHYAGNGGDIIRPPLSENEDVSMMLTDTSIDNPTTTTTLPSPRMCTDIIYSTAFWLAEDHREHPLSCSLAAIFNLSLTYHLWGVSSCCEEEEAAESTGSRQQRSACASREFLSTAAKLYKLSYNLLTQMANMDCFGTLALGICNNLAQVHCCLQNHNESRYYVDFLISAFMYLQSTNNSSVDYTSPETTPILTSVAGLILSSPMSSPAA